MWKKWSTVIIPSDANNIPAELLPYVHGMVNCLVNSGTGVLVVVSVFMSDETAENQSSNFAKSERQVPIKV